MHPDGTLAVAAGGRELRLFAPDGRLLYRSADATEFGQGTTEVLAYGTAVRLEPG